tara:strand:- start:1663 stop:2328 length:666 start_codon:yes stop_codon:yes gene_type:complete
MNEIVLDTETTGLSVENGHRIVEIGCIELKDQILTPNRFHCYLNPQRKVSEEAFKVHGYSDKFLSDKKKFAEIADDFVKFIGDKKLVIHNAQFDLSHLNNELKILGKKPIPKDQVIDTLDIAREKFPGSQISLDALCKRFRIDNSKRKLHTALIDCELLSKVYINLIDQKEPRLNFFKNNDDIKIHKNFKGGFCRRIIQPSVKELKEHQSFLKKSLKKNYF